jgi:ATP/maltotriose-dependent transcriptional regulator MalT
MINRGPSTTELEWCLRELRAALEAGDVAAAHAHLDRVGDVLSVEHVATSRHLGLVGGVRLTGREAATLQFLPDGSMSQKDIARELGVSPNTVKTHLKAIYQKLGVHGRGEAIHRARDLGLLAAVGARTVPTHREPTARMSVVDSATA